MPTAGSTSNEPFIYYHLLLNLEDDLCGSLLQDLIISDNVYMYFIFK